MTLERTTPNCGGAMRPASWLMLDRSRGAVWTNGGRVPLRHKELELLVFLVDRADHYVTRDEILEAVWDDRFGTCTNTLHVHLSRLRAKLGESPGAPVFVHSCRRRGVRMAGVRAQTFHPAVELYVARSGTLRVPDAA